MAKRAGKFGMIPKALIAGAGTYALGRGLALWYERDVSYERLNAAILGMYRKGRDQVALAHRA